MSLIKKIILECLFVHLVMVAFFFFAPVILKFNYLNAQNTEHSKGVFFFFQNSSQFDVLAQNQYT